MPAAYTLIGTRLEANRFAPRGCKYGSPLARRIGDKAGELLQTLVHQRYRLKRSIVVTSNRVVQDWGKYPGDNTIATTILDRLMHRAHILEFEGKSYRLKETASRLTRLTSADKSGRLPTVSINCWSNSRSAEPKVKY